MPSSYHVSNNAHPEKAVIDNQGRLIVMWHMESGSSLIAFTTNGAVLSELYLTDASVRGQPNLAYDAQRNYIVYSIHNHYNVLDINDWLPGSFLWDPSRHRLASRSLRALVFTVVCIRDLVPLSCLSALPNELLFEIFTRL